jgi:CO dehydrogenase nickel-insertion accessory protein CooC1
MALIYDIDVQISGREHQGKTNFVALLTKLLDEAGVEHIVQRADAQLPGKLEFSVDELKAKLAGKTIFIREVQSAY